MTTYCNYEYYRDVFKGSLTEAQFTSSVLPAQAVLDIHTHHRINMDTMSEKVQELVKCCLCALCDAQSAFVTHKGISSESIGDMSVSYSSPATSGSTAFGSTSEAFTIIESWLGNTGLMYCGFR